MRITSPYRLARVRPSWTMNHKDDEIGLEENLYRIHSSIDFGRGSAFEEADNGSLCFTTRQVALARPNRSRRWLKFSLFFSEIYTGFRFCDIQYGGIRVESTLLILLTHKNVCGAQA